MLTTKIDRCWTRPWLILWRILRRREPDFWKFFLTEININHNVFTDMLENFMFPQIKQMEEAGSHNIFQQGETQEELNGLFPERWIGKNASIPWPERH
ncbi:hypothetical protein ANN_15414 [Periplaneta americana]|uniref:Uncharacterized protein n=1 Tax=Periplaneta americana TaxID=6978 RepID=A0ABQ8SHF9_PERAM|nr:hypothetical protein ANN_15414 [Periplaneta americana]